MGWRLVVRALLNQTALPRPASACVRHTVARPGLYSLPTPDPRDQIRVILHIANAARARMPSPKIALGQFIATSRFASSRRDGLCLFVRVFPPGAYFWCASHMWIGSAILPSHDHLPAGWAGARTKDSMPELHALRSALAVFAFHLVHRPCNSSRLLFWHPVLRLHVAGQLFERAVTLYADAVFDALS